ncbi:hypothetical protein BJP62_05950 [Jeongeupia sp. USM3]|nr:hypothetical protein BJP62_05950 [Jeongeupia sp. USM3]
MSVSLIALIAAKSGLTFQPVLAASAEAAHRSVIEGRSYLLPQLSPTQHRRLLYLFSTPYTAAPAGIFVLSNNNRISGLDDMAGKRVGLLQRTETEEAMAALAPARSLNVRFVIAPDMLKLLQWLVEGRIDAISGYPSTVRILAAQHYPGKLKLAFTVGSQPDPLAFAVNKQHPELVGIINKVIDSIPRNELKAMQHEWTESEFADTQRVHADRQLRLLLLFGALLVVLGLAAFAFNGWRNAVKQRRLRARLAIKQTVLNGLPFAVFMQDAQGVIVTCNTHFAAAFGLNAEALAGQPADRLAALDAFPLIESLNHLCSTAQQHGEYTQADVQLALPQGSRDLFLWAIPLQDAARQDLMGGWIDISDRKQAERELAAARLEADQANRAKSTFLATISHEIRTPMNSILGLLELEVRRHGPASKAALDTIHASAYSLLGLLNDVLDQAKIEAGELSIHPRPTALAVEFERLLTIYRPMAKERQLQLNAQLAADLPAWVQVDGLRLRQVLSNLLTNAFKFTTQGEVGFNASWQAFDTACGRLVIRVSDTGIGMPPDVQARLFQPFQQAQGDQLGKLSGTGLGLWICKHLVDRMAGTITVDSEAGHGSRFTVTLPLQLSEAEDEPPQPTESVGAVQAERVLVVDDHPPNRMLIAEQLTFLGVGTIVTAADGAEALTRLAEQPFDLVLTDGAMPNVDGYELTQRIRANPDWVHLVVIGYSADARDEARKRALTAGMDDYLLKPVSIDMLQRALCRADQPIKTEPPAPAVAGSRAALEQAVFTVCRGDRNLTIRYLSVLLKTAEQDMADFIGAMARNDVTALARATHKIRGGALLLGEQVLAATCDTLETALGSRAPAECADECTVVIQALQAMMDVLATMLGNLERA